MTKLKRNISLFLEFIGSFNKHLAAFYLILLSAFFLRFIYIDYNSAFNDEAIYIVIGRMGLFANDWWSYGANLWMAGLPFIYPPMTGLSYELGGLIFSRLLNVVMGVVLIEEVYRFVRLLHFFDEETNKKAALLAAFLVAFSGIGIFVSKLATYDMPSFLLLFVGINTFLKAKNFTNGKYYFLTFLCLLLAFFSKIVIAVFLPVLFVLAIFMLKDRSVQQRKMAIWYLFVPFALCIFLYVVFNFQNLLTYVLTHKDLGKTNSYMEIINVIWSETSILALLAIPSFFVFLKIKKYKQFLIFIMLALIIPLFHLPLLRLATLDKHMYLSVIFLAVIVGCAGGYVLSSLSMKNIYSKALIVVVCILAGVGYMGYGQTVTAQHENGWRNSHRMEGFLRNKVKPGDKILTEEGAVTVLTLYDVTFPPKNIVTFDWIDYAGREDDGAYIMAVNDQYFDYIQLDSESEGKELKTQIKKSLSPNYVLIYNHDSYQIYEKKKI